MSYLRSCKRYISSPKPYTSGYGLMRCDSSAGNKSPLRYRRIEEDRGRRRQITPRPVRSVSELQPVEIRLKGGLSTGKQGEQSRQRLEDADRPVRLPPKKPIRAVRGKKRHPSASQVYVVWAYGHLHGFVCQSSEDILPR